MAAVGEIVPQKIRAGAPVGLQDAGWPIVVPVVQGLVPAMGTDRREQGRSGFSDWFLIHSLK